MKYQQFETVEWSGATHIKDVKYIKDICNFNDDTIYYVVVDGVDWKVYKYIISTNTETLEQTISETLLADPTCSNPIIIILQNVLYILCTWIDTTNEDVEILFKSYTFNTSVWATESDISFAYNTTVFEGIHAIDVLDVGGSIFYCFEYYTFIPAVDDSWVMYFYTKAGVLVDSSGVVFVGVDYPLTIKGYINKDDGYYHYIRYIDNNDIEERHFNGAAISGIDYDIDDKITPVYNPNAKNSFFVRKGKGEIWLWDQYLWYHDWMNDIWTDYGRTDDNKCCFIRDSNNVITQIIWNGSVYLWEDAGALCLIQEAPSISIPKDFKKTIDFYDITGVIQWGVPNGEDLSDYTVSGGTLDTNEIVALIDEHENVVHNIQDSTVVWYRDIGVAVASGSVECFIRLGQVNKALTLAISDSANNFICRAIFEADGNIDFEGTVNDADIQAYLVNTWYHLKIDFLRNGACELFLDGVSISTRTGNNAADSDYLFRMSAGANDLEYWFDAHGYSGDSYIVGSNRFLTETDFICGCLDFFIADQSIYRKTELNFAIDTRTAPIVETEIYKVPTFKVSSRVEPFNNQYFIIYDNNCNEVYRGYGRISKEKDGVYTYKTKHGGELDLDNKIEDSYVSMTAANILKQDMDNECSFLRYGRGTNEDVHDFVSGLTGWTNNDGVSCVSSYLSEKILGGVKIKDVLQQYDNSNPNACNVNKTIDNSLILSGWIGVSDNTKVSYVTPYEGATIIGYLAIHAGAIQWYDGAWQSIQAITNNIWYHWALVFDATVDTVDIYINSSYKQTENTWNNITTTINKLQFQTGGTPTGWYVWHSKPYWSSSLYDAMSAYNSISPIPTNTHTLKSKRKTLLDRQIWADAQEGHVFSIRPNGLCYWDIFSNGVIINEKFDGSPDLEHEPIKSSKVIIYGGAPHGTTYKGVAYGEPNFGTYWDEFDELDTQAKVDSMAAQILADKNKKLGKFHCKTYGLGHIYAGTSITLTCSKYNINAETWYCVQSKYNPITDKNELWLTDAYWVPHVDRTTENNRQAIGVLEERVTWIERGADVSDWDETDLVDDVNWNDLDLSGIIGVDKMDVRVHIDAEDNVVDSEISIRWNGCTCALGHHIIVTTVGNKPVHGNYDGGTGPLGKVEIKCIPKPLDWSSIDITVTRYRPA